MHRACERLRRPVAGVANFQSGTQPNKLVWMFVRCFSMLRAKLGQYNLLLVAKFWAPFFALSLVSTSEPKMRKLLNRARKILEAGTQPKTVVRAVVIENTFFKVSDVVFQ